MTKNTITTIIIIILYSIQWPIQGGSAKIETFFKVKVYEKVQISQVDVCERVEKSGILVV